MTMTPSEAPTAIPTFPLLFFSSFLPLLPSVIIVIKSNVTLQLVTCKLLIKKSKKKAFPVLFVGDFFSLVDIHLPKKSPAK